MNALDEQTKSLWMQVEVLPDCPPLHGKHQCDIVVIGAGIAGISVAYELACAGQKVVVIDRGHIAGGVTSRTTAHLAPICDDGLSALIDMRGEHLARKFQESQEAAVDRIEQIVSDLNISCNFRRLDAMLFPLLGMKDKEAREQRDKEFEAAEKLGVKAKRITGVPLKGLEHAPALLYPNQATFHPTKYLKSVVEAVQERGGAFFAHSPVREVEEKDDGVKVICEDGSEVHASYAVVCTNSPINSRFKLHSSLAFRIGHTQSRTLCPAVQFRMRCTGIWRILTIMFG